MNKKKSGALLIALCWIVYTCAYLGKYSYSSNTIKVITHYGVTKADAGLISTLFFVAYGIGQVVNGICCKFYPKKYMIGGAILASAAINTILYFDVPFWLIKYLWLVNGIAQSVLWPTLILTLSAYLSRTKLKSAVLVMATTVAVGTAAALMKKYKMEGKVKLTDDAWKEFLKRHKDKTGGREVTNEIEAIMEKIPIQDAYKTATTDAPYMITPDILKKLLASLI